MLILMNELQRLMCYYCIFKFGRPFMHVLRTYLTPRNAVVERLLSSTRWSFTIVSDVCFHLLSSANRLCAVVNKTRNRRLHYLQIIVRLLLFFNGGPHPIVLAHFYCFHSCRNKTYTSGRNRYVGEIAKTRPHFS
jgi:hypothetical protein